MANTAYIYQAKHIEREFWVACKDQIAGEGEKSYIIVTNDGIDSGLWYWIHPVKKYKTKNNNGMICWRVPIEDCVKIKELEDIQNEGIIRVVKKMQQDWFDGKVTNQKAKKRKNKYYLK